MKVKNPKYELTAVKPEQYPNSIIPEVAFVGRSNVGKSSIINTLLNRKNLARVGQTPGKTRVINFYNIDDILFFVDLPGYGYAKVSKEEKKSWGKLAETYLHIRDQLKLIIMLVDIRHKPTADDRLMYEWICTTGLPHLVVATKEDKVKRSQVIGRKKEIRETLEMTDDVEVITFSALKRTGIDKLWEAIDIQVLVESADESIGE